MTLETGAIKELSKQSDCSILQGTKVGSAKEHDQIHLNSPESKSAVNTFSSKRSYQVLRKLGILQQIPTFPSNIHAFLTSIPGSLCLKIVLRRYIKYSKESLPPQFKTSPRESSLAPLESWNPSPQAVGLSPVDSGSLSLAEHERVVRLYSKSYFLNRI